MKILVISASTRANSQSRKISNVLMYKLSKLSVQHELIDLAELNLPIYNDEEQQIWQAVLPKFEEADAFVLVVPEWNGSAGPGVPNLLTYTSIGTKPLAHKPILLVAVSSGAGGAYPIAQLKAYGNKNNFAIHIPEQLSFRNVKEVFNSNEPDETNDIDISLHKRTEYSLSLLVEYAIKLGQIRDSGVINLKDYRYGS